MSTTRDLKCAANELGVDFDPAIFILENIADTRLDLNVRMKYAIDMIPYFYAKKKDVSIDSSTSINGSVSFRWMSAVEEKESA